MRIIFADYHPRPDHAIRHVVLGLGAMCDVVDYSLVTNHVRRASKQANGTRLCTTRSTPALELVEQEPLVFIRCYEGCTRCFEAIRAVREVSNRPIYACGDSTDPLCIRSALRAGAADFLEMERMAEEVERIFSQTNETTPLDVAVADITLTANAQIEAE